MSGFSLRGIRKLFLSSSYKNINISELNESWDYEHIQINKNHLIVDCVVYPRRKLQEFVNSYWDSSDLVENYGLEKNFTTKTKIEFYNRKPEYMLGGLDITSPHILVSCEGELFGIVESNPVHEAMLPKRVLHFWRGFTTKKSDWSDLLTDLNSSKINIYFPAILVFEKEKNSETDGYGNLRIYAQIPKLSLLMRFLDTRGLI
jgi:hypothetical protein